MKSIARWRCIFCLTILSLFLPVAANSAVEGMDRFFKTLCIGEQATGFDWVNGDWTPTRFKPERYLIEKLPVDNNMTPFCAMKLRDHEPFESKDSALEYGCYNVHAFGREGYPNLSGLCLEEWKKISGQWVLQSVFCNDREYVQFKPNGAFILAEWSEPHDLDDNADHKDSKSITVGRCAVMF